MEMQNQNTEMKGGKTNTELYVQLALIGVLLVLLTFNAGRLFSGKENITGTITNTAAGIGAVSVSEITPKGLPAVYGQELGVKYDDVSSNNPQFADQTIDKLSATEDMELTANEMERYKKIGMSISCEYCCGAQSIIFSNGERACGCAHSFAMRGLAKYLLRNHPNMTDEQILSELGKWKVLFFPGVHEQKAQVLESKGIDSSDYINLASNKYRGAEKGQAQASSGGMVGGC